MKRGRNFAEQSIGTSIYQFLNPVTFWQLFVKRLQCYLLLVWCWDKNNSQIGRATPRRDLNARGYLDIHDLLANMPLVPESAQQSQKVHFLLQKSTSRQRKSRKPKGIYGVLMGCAWEDVHAGPCMMDPSCQTPSTTQSFLP